MDFVDTKYISILSSKLTKFKKVKNNLYNFRCPICGDSQKNKNRARGYFYQVKNNTNFKCHNCGINISFNNFLKNVDLDLHKKYTFDKFKEGKTGKNFVAEEPKFNFHKPDFSTRREKSEYVKKLNLPKASENEDAKIFLEKRKLNPDTFYYAEKFMTWVNTITPKFENVRYDEPRIIIPLFYNQNLIGVQGRSLSSKSVKYITVMFNDDAPKIYGLDNIRTDAPVYVTEGPFDSTFLCNSIAMCGSDANIDNWGISDAIWVYDNEPRNREIMSRISRAIETGQKVVIWPSTINQKDINDMVLAGLDVKSVIESNTYSGLEAKLKFTTWKKI
jgi:ssDNA-binding Zn-finger/Zn-ribbon topoisomerase 1